VFWDKGTFITGFVPRPLTRVSWMEKNNTQKRTVELENSFEAVWNSVSGKAIELETEELKTPFVVKARMVKR